MIKLAQAIGILGLVFLLLTGFISDQVRPKPPHVYDLLLKKAMHGTDTVVASPEIDSEVVADVALASQMLESDHADIAAYQRYILVATSIGAIALIVIIIVLEIEQRKRLVNSSPQLTGDTNG